MIAGVVCAVLLVLGVGITALVVGTGGDDDDDDSAADPSGSSSATTPTDPSSPGDPSTLNLPTPSGTSTTPSTTFVRTKPSGGDKAQVRQLVEDWSEWTAAIYQGDVGACDYMQLYVVTVPKKTLIACRRSAATPLPDGDKITTKPGPITVNGNRGTVTIKYNYVFDGKPNHTTSKQDVVKKNGTWYFAKQ